MDTTTDDSVKSTRPRHGLLYRTTALVLSWAMPATTVWAVAPPEPPAPSPYVREAHPTPAYLAQPSPLRMLETLARLATEGKANGGWNGPSKHSYEGRGVTAADLVHGAVAAHGPNAEEALYEALLTEAAATAPDPPPGPTCDATFFGPTRYTRTCGPKNVYTATVTPPAWIAGPFTMRVWNGEANGTHRISSAWVEVGGSMILQPTDFNQNVYLLERTVSLSGPTSLKVTLASHPGSYLTIGFCGGNADHTAPQVSVPEPLDGSVTGDDTPRVLVRYEDLLGSGEPGASGMDLTTFKVKVDGVDRTSLFVVRPTDATADLPALAEGAHQVMAEIKDKVGNLGTATSSFRVDKTAPVIQVATPQEGAYVGPAHPELRITYSDETALDTATLRIHVNGQDRTSLFTVGPNEATATADESWSLPQGANQLLAEVRDRAGNPAQASRGFRVDRLPPTLTIAQPTQASRHGSDVEVIVQYADDQELDLTTFRATVDGSTVTLGQGPEGAMGHVGPLSDGPHTVAAEIKDKAGNLVTRSAGFVVDTQAPVVQVLQPLTGITTNDATPHVLVTFSDNDGLDMASLVIKVNGIDRTSQFTIGAGQASLTLEGALPEGPNEIVATIRDLAANVGTGRSDFTVDTVAPTGSLDQPGDWTGSQSPTLVVSYADERSGVDPASVHVFVDGDEKTALFVIGASQATGSVGPLADGQHQVRVTFSDRAGNPGLVEDAFGVDTAAPTLQIAAPSPDQFTNDRTPALRLTYNDGNGTGSGIAPGSVRLFLRKGAEAEVEITPYVTAGATEATGVVPDTAALQDATYHMRAVVADAVGNQTQVAGSFDVDTVPPTYSVVIPADTAFLPTHTPSFTVRYQDDRAGFGAGAFSFAINGTDLTDRLTWGATEATGTLRPGDALPDGAYTTAVRVTDRAGNQAVAVPHGFVVDTVPPQGVVEVPVDGAYLGAPQALVRATYGDSGTAGNGVDPVGVVITIDGIDRTLEFAVTGTEATATLGVPMANGTHAVRVTVKDWAGNQATPKSDFTVDTDAPVLTIVAPPEDSYHRTATVDVTGTVVDADPQVSVTAVVGQGAPVPCSVSGTGFTCPVTLAEGENAVTVTAKDRFDRPDTKTRRLKLDTTAPQVIIVDPGNGSWTGATELPVRVGVVDASPIASVTVNGVTASQDGPAWVATVTVGPGPDVTIVAEATDVAQNAGTSDPVVVHVDRQNPTVTITQPTPGSYVQGPSVTVSGTASDDNPGVRVEVNGQPANLSGSDWSIQVPVGEGSQSFTATAYDVAGNSATSTVENVTVDQTPPVITATTPAPGTTVVTNAASLTIAGTVTDASPVTLTIGGTAVVVSGGSFSVEVPLGGEGAKDFVLEARDQAGNVGTAHVTAIVDRTPPDLTVLVPASGTVVGSVPLVVQGTVTDLTQVTVTVAGTSATVSGTTWQAELTSGEGSQTLEVVATDQAGNGRTVSWPVTVDLLAPVLLVTAPPEGYLTKESTVTVTGTASDLSLREVVVSGVTATLQETSPGQYAWTAPSVPLTVEGDNHLIATAKDALNREDTEDRHVTRDQTAPVVHLTVPETITRGRPGQAVVEATDANGIQEVEILVDGTRIGLFTAPPYVAALTVPEGAQSGSTLVVVARAKDAPGNTGTDTRGVRVGADGALVGQVLDDGTSLPLEGATVSLGATGNTQTDEEGRYALPTGEAEALLSITKAGFTSVYRDVDVASGVGTVPVDARLTILGDPESKQAGEPLEKGSVRVDVGASGTYRLTVLSGQGLPGLLPLGYSPLAALDLQGPNGAQGLRVEGLGTLTTAHLARFNVTLRAWVLESRDLAVVDGVATAVLSDVGSYALVAVDPTDPPIAVPQNAGEPLVGVGVVELPATATSTGQVSPATLPPSGGTAMGTLSVVSPTPLPSGTVVSAEVTETFTLANGEIASEEMRREDLLLFRLKGSASCPTGSTLCATFPITPSRTFEPEELVEGRVHLDILAGRESVRGTTGGNVPVTVTDGDSRLVIPANALGQDVAIELTQEPLSSFLPTSTNLLALGEVLVDFSGRTLLIPAELSIRAVGGVVEGDTLVLAKVERIEGVPKLTVVSLAQLLGDRVVTRTGGGLPGVIEGGRYVFYRTSPLGFVAGTTSTTNGPVRAVVSTDTLPFIALAGANGHYLVAALPGPVHVSAIVPRTTLAGSGQAVVNATETAPLDITLTGTATTATVTPPDGSLGIPTSVQLEIEATAPLKPQTVTFTNILLKKDSDGTPVPVLLSLSGSRKVIGIVPQAALEYSTAYRLEVSGLLDTYDGAVNVPVTRFTTKDNVAPVYNVDAIVFSFPDANGMVTVSAPAGTLPPGTTILIINEGNGVVVSFMAGNDGAFTGDLPASISDRLMVTVTDPSGNVTSFQRSQYVAPDGTTGIGPGGGTVKGPGNVELRIPDGAVTRGVTLKIAGVSADELATLFPSQAPDLPGAQMGSGIKIESPDKPTFKKEIDVAFPLPAGLPATPTDAWFYVYRRVELPPATDGTPRSAFETIDQAFIEGTGADAKVVTASYPFSGYLTSFGGITMPAAGQIALQAYASNYAILMWSYDQLLPAKPLPGVVTGKVRRTKWNPGSSVPEYEAIKEAKVTGLDQPLGTSNGNFAVTNDDGVFTLWDPAYTGGPVTVRATVKTPTGSESLEAVAYQANAADWGTTGLQHYRNIATVNITFDAVEPPPAAPVLEVRVMKKNPDGTLTNTNGLAVVDDDLVIGFVSHLLNGNVLTVNSVTIQGQPYSTQGPLTDDPNDFDFVVNGDYTPGNPGTYRIEATALVPMGSPISISSTFRVIAAGGQVETDLANPPSVIFRSPKANALGVPVDVFPELRFNEPVKNLPGNVHLYELACDAAGICTTVGEVGLTLSGVGPGGAFPNVGADTVITTLTLQPLVGLKYGTDPSPIALSPRYRISLTDEIVDLDTPTAKRLTPFTSEFETFKPTGVGGTEEHFGSPGIVVLQDRAYLVQNNFVNGTLRAYNVSDPVEPTEILSAQATVTWRPVDLAGEENTSVTGGRLIAISTGSTTQSKPSNVYVFDTSSDAQSKWIGAVSLTSSAMDGFIFRTAVKGGWLYAATYRKGIQAVDLLQVKSVFPPCCTIDYWNMVQAFNADGQGFGQENVVSIPVMNASNQPVRLWDLEAADYTVDNTLQRYVVATGEEPLVVVNPGSQAISFRGVLEARDGATVLARLAVGKAIGLGRVNDQELAVVAGHGTIGTTATPLAMVVSMANPAAPQVLGFVALANAPQDVLVKDDMALVGHESSVSVMSLTEPNAPVVTGTLDDMGGRLALVDNLLFSTAFNTTGGTFELGGIRTAVLGNVALIDGTTPRVIVVGENLGGNQGPRVVEKFDVKYRVIPPSYEVHRAELQLWVDQASYQQIPAPMTDGRGQVPLPLGYQIPQVGGKLSNLRLVVNPDDPSKRLVSPARQWNLEQPKVAFVWGDRSVEREAAPDAELKGSVVTTDLPEMEAEVVSDEWIRRQIEAEEGAPPPTMRNVDWRAVTAPGWAQVSLANDGVFDARLDTGTVAGAPWQLEAHIGGIPLGRTDAFALEPGVARTISIVSTSPELLADEASSITVTATVRDGFGNLVGDDTPVTWQIVDDGDGDGRIIYTSPGTAVGQAIAVYMAGADFGRLKLRAYADEAMGEITLERLPVPLTINAPTHTYWQAPVEVTLNAPGVPDSAEVSWFSTAGLITPTQGLQNGVARARWAMGPRAYRKKVQVIAFVGKARANVDVQLDRDPAPGTPEAAATSQAGPAVSVEPMVIAGDLTADGPADFELPDGTTVTELVKATATYKVTGLVPGHHVTLRLGTWRRPNAEPVLHLSQQRDGATLYDLTGRHDAQISGGVATGVSGYDGEGLRFDGSGLLTIAHDAEFEFGSGFMLQVAVRPGAPVTAEAVLFDKPGDYRLSLVPVAGETRVRLTMETATGPVDLVSQAVLDPQSWTVLSGRYDAGRIYLGLNGQEDSVALPAAPAHGSSALQVGTAYVGDMDEVRLFDLSTGALSTFANGSQTMSFVVDATGTFETQIVSTGQFAQDRAPESAASGRAADPTLTERKLGIYFTELETWIEESGEQTDHPVGITAAWVLVAMVKFVRGIVVGSEGQDDLIVIAGDLVGTFAGPLFIYSLVRDLVNAGERAVRMQATGQDAWVMSACVIGLVAALTRVKVLGKAGRLLKITTRGSESGRAMARLAALEAKIATGAPVLSKAEKIVQVINSGQAAEAAVRLVVTYIGNSETVIGFFNNVLTGSPEPEAVSAELAIQAADMGSEDFRMYITALGREFPEESGATPNPAAGSTVVAAPRAAPRLMAVNVRLLKGAYNKGMKPASAAERRVLAKTLVEKIRDSSKRSGTRTAKISEALSHIPDGGRNVVQLLKQLGYRSDNKVKAARATLKLTSDVFSGDAVAKQRFFTNLRLGNSVTTGFHGVEEAFKISSWLTKTGRVRQRFMDLILEIRGLLVRIEIKAFDRMPTPREFEGMVDAMRRDLVKHLTDPSFSFDRLRWVFSDKFTTAERAIIIKELKKAASGKQFRKRLFDAGVPQADLSDKADEARSAVDRIVCFHDLEL